MVLDRALTDAEIRRDILAGLAGEDPFHDLALSRSETRHPVRSSLPPRQQLARVPRPFESSLDAGDKLAGVTGFWMKSEAPAFMA